MLRHILYMFPEQDELYRTPIWASSVSLVYSNCLSNKYYLKASNKSFSLASGWSLAELTGIHIRPDSSWCKCLCPRRVICAGRLHLMLCWPRRPRLSSSWPVCLPHRGHCRHRDPGGRLVEHWSDQLPAGPHVSGKPGQCLWCRHR